MGLYQRQNTRLNEKLSKPEYFAPVHALENPSPRVKRADIDDESDSDSAATLVASSDGSNEDEENDIWTRCDFTAISNGQYTQSETCEKAYMNGLHLDCMLRQKTHTPSKFINHVELEENGWEEEVNESPEYEIFHMDKAFQGLGINSDATSWAEVRVEHCKDSTAPEGRPCISTGAEYQNYYNVKDGVLVATLNYGPEYMARLGNLDTSKIPPLRQWSDVCFLSIEEYCRTQAGGAASIQGLQHIFRRDVKNKKTLNVLKAIVEARNPRHLLVRSFLSSDFIKGALLNAS